MRSSLINYAQIGIDFENFLFVSKSSVTTVSLISGWLRCHEKYQHINLKHTFDFCLLLLKMVPVDLFCFWCKANDSKCLFMALLINDESSICRHHIRSIFFKQPPNSRSVSSLYVHTFCRIVTKLKLMTKSPFMIQRHSRGLLEVWTTIWSLLVLLQANVFF